MIPPAARLPLGFTVILNRLVTVHDGGRTLVGGSPTRVLYLSEVAVPMLAGRTVRVSDAKTRALAERLLEAGMADPVASELPALGTDRVTFVVPVWGRPAALDRLLASIGPGQNVIVVDDCSPDQRAVADVAQAHGARLIRLPVNIGPSGARNAGLRQVATRYVAFADTDVVLDPGTVPTLLRHFADPRVALAAPRVLGLADEHRSTWIGRYEQARSSLDLGPHPAAVRPRSPVSWVPTAFVVARVDALEEGFSLLLRSGEDVDLVWRLVEQGWRIRFEPSAQVFHEHRATVTDWLSRKAFYGSSAHSLAVRHPRNIAPAVLAPWSTAVIAALMAQRPWSLPAALGITAAAAYRISRKLGRSRHPFRLGASLAASGATSALAQAMALLVRHWWPLTLAAGFFSRRVRRAALLAGLVDTVLEYRRLRPGLDPVRFGLARRLDDLAYGAGVWFGALKGRSAAALLPEVRGRE